MLNFAEQTGSGAVIMVWSSLRIEQVNLYIKLNTKSSNEHPAPSTGGTYQEGIVQAQALFSCVAPGPYIAKPQTQSRH
jgi:hypothetical protein